MIRLLVGDGSHGGLVKAVNFRPRACQENRGMGNDNELDLAFPAHGFEQVEQLNLAFG